MSNHRREREQNQKRPGKSPPEKEKTCKGKFLANRQRNNFYRLKTNGQIPGKLACTKTATKQEPERISIPIYWALLGRPRWSRQEAQAKLDDASRWFAGYCITLTIYPIVLRAREVRRFGAELQAADGRGPVVHAGKVGDIYKKLWQRAGRPADLLMILFVDTFRAVKYDGQRVNRVAGNFDKIPVIMIPSDPDRGSRHIVTHELIHGLGKKRISGSPPKTTVPGSGMDRINTWDEGACPNEMANSRRANPTARLTKSDEDLLDWASYYQFYARAKTIA